MRRTTCTPRRDTARRSVVRWLCEAWGTGLRAAALLLLMGTSAAAQTATEPGAQLQVELGSHAGAVRRLAVLPDRDLVATGADDKTARLWSLAEGSLQHVLRPPAGPGDAGRVYGVALHPVQPWVAIGGSVAAAGGPAIHLHDTRSGDHLRRIDALAGDVKRLLWNSDGSVLLAAQAGAPGAHGVRGFDPEGREVFADRFDSAVYALAVAPGRLAVAALDGSLRLYAQAPPGAAPRYTELWRLQLDSNPVSLAFAPAGEALAVGYFLPGRAPDVVDLRSRRVTTGVAPPALERGTLMSVAWSADGRHVYAAGAYPFVRRNARLVVFTPGARSGDEIETGAPSTITDLVTLADGRVAFASADGSWGVLAPGTRQVRLQRAQLPDLDGATRLHIGRDGRSASWTLDAGRDRISFDLARRLVLPGAVDGLLPPLLRRGLLDAPSEWENHRQPQVNGARIAMAPDELSRAVALLAGGTDAVLGTSRALYRIGPRGAVQWRRPMHTEVRAVNVTPDGRLLFAAMLDGTVRIARASDGLELLALLVLPDRRWVLWTPDGHFDAAVGADRLVGWLVNRSDGSAADHYPAARFRERLHQPRYIDLLLETLDPEQALRRHAEEVRAEQAAAAPALAAGTAAPEGRLGPAPGALQALGGLEPVGAASLALPRPALPPLPPLLQSAQRAIRLQAPAVDSEVEVEVPVAVRSAASAGAVSFEVRIDGRPGELLGVSLVPAADGASRGHLRLRVPAGAASVQLLARNLHGVSEAWLLAVQATLPPPPAPAPAPPPALAQLPGAPAAALPSLAPLGPAPGAAALPGLSAAAPALRALPAARAPGGRLFVLSVGVSAYARPEYSLRLAAKDAADFASVIRTQQGKLYSEVVVRTLLDGQATRAAVLAALTELAGAGGKGDTFMVFMAGHGVNGSSGAYYFMTSDARHENLAASAVADRELRAALRRVPGRTLLFIDTCHAGSVLGATTGRNGELARFVNDMSDNGVVVFAASSGRQESLEQDDWGNGAFTSALLDGLRGKADVLRAGRVTYKGLDYYVSEQVQRLTQGRQTPVSLSPFGVPDFELARL
ncbi:caspase family protein [Rubrivivax sp. RP6-9]|uniref:caspase family protein n=1 Tax=Rubrivivax sp. RP6-9 TaxID=3415750 RepID=UPI003CC550E7